MRSRHEEAWEQAWERNRAETEWREQQAEAGFPSCDFCGRQTETEWRKFHAKPFVFTFLVGRGAFSEVFDSPWLACRPCAAAVDGCRGDAAALAAEIAESRDGPQDVDALTYLYRAFLAHRRP